MAKLKLPANIFDLTFVKVWICNDEFWPSFPSGSMDAIIKRMLESAMS